MAYTAKLTWLRQVSVASCDEHGNKLSEGGNSAVFKRLLTSQWFWSLAFVTLLQLNCEI
jgi:hypothetical protein